MGASLCDSLLGSTGRCGDFPPCKPPLDGPTSNRMHDQGNTSTASFACGSTIDSQGLVLMQPRLPVCHQRSQQRQAVPFCLGFLAAVLCFALISRSWAPNHVEQAAAAPGGVWLPPAADARPAATRQGGGAPPLPPTPHTRKKVLAVIGVQVRDKQSLTAVDLARPAT
jgi:hypothetical protein